ncbi:MAG: hypothetical protein JSS36_09540 [Proteobacteria bacterium]|nr:hypothetical protein [Pseudomonadota bacterium]
MSTSHADPNPPDSAEATLRQALARGDAAQAGVAPVLRHLLVAEDHGLFAEEVVTRVRGTLADLSGQLCHAVTVAHGLDAPLPPEDPAVARLARQLAEIPALLAHVHALALEAQAAAQLRARLGLDPVLSPLVQALVASPEAETADLAMRFLAAEARFQRQVLAMRLPLGELPPELLHGALLALRECLGGAGGTPHPDFAACAEPAAEAIRANYDERASRLGLAARIVTGLGGGVVAALQLPHAGLGLFASALALATAQHREQVLLAIQPGQGPRLALMLRAAGLRQAAIDESLAALDAGPTPAEVLRLDAARAAQLLAGG